MQYRALGRTGVQVCALCLGCMNFGGCADEAASAAIIDRALEAGVNFIDTADVYGHDPADFRTGRGRSEEIVGRALRAGGRRDRVVLATKAHFPMGDDPNARGNTRRHLIAACEASLRRLQTDYIDLYQLHHPSNEVPIDETLRALDDLVRAGKVRYLGTSAFAAWQLVESLWAAKELGLNRFVCEQPPFHLLDRRAERELLPMAQTYGLAVLPWSPTAGGFLAGRYLRHGRITHLVIDECHHATAATYLSLRRALLEANPDLYHLGVTATPLRADGDGLSRVYQKDSARVTIADLVKLGWLVAPRWLAIDTKISIAGVHTCGGDFVASELAETFDTPNGRRIVVAAYQQYAKGRRAIAFTASVAGAHALAASFNDVGIVAAAVDGTTPPELRADILRRYKQGDITVLVNCQCSPKASTPRAPRAC